jgi:uncharacterized protein YdbL (DUF1318 family)
MPKRFQYFPAVFIIFSCLLLLAATAASAASIKDRMAARLPAITALKNQGILGENNQGFLEFRGPAQQQQLVAEENSDRLQVYTAIAKQQGVPVNLVGERRAAMIASKGQKGQQFQKPDGSWYTR